MINFTDTSVVATIDLKTYLLSKSSEKKITTWWPKQLIMMEIHLNFIKITQ